ncbi:MAG TPA: hypothetical protein VIN38_13200 [Thiobacillus sp.]
MSRITHPRRLIMRKSVLLMCLVSSTLLFKLAHATPPSPYSGQESREIKALSSEDVQAYLSGKGLGLAKAAELNGYPGPSHVLALAGELGLTAKQKQRTQSLFKNMEVRAISIGRPLVEEEHKLDQLFAQKKITPKLLNQSLARIGALQAQVRGAHLEAHLAQTEILTQSQVSKYMTLRGYSNTPGAEGPAGHKHH